MGLLLVGLSAVSVATLGAFVYTSSRDAVERDAFRTVGLTASARHAALLLRLKARRERAETFLTAVAEGPGLAGMRREAALRAQLRQFVATEKASSALLQFEGQPPIAVGDLRVLTQRLPAQGALEIATFVRIPERAYIVRARDVRGNWILLRHPMDDIDQIFQDREGLGRSGETFLTDSRGLFLTPPRFETKSAESHPIHSRPMEICLAGFDQEAVDKDYRGADIIHGFRHVPEIGGGCVMAHIDQAEAFAPVRNLRVKIITTIALLALVSLWLSFVFARAFSQPILELQRRARRLQEGDYDAPVPIRGPTEIRTFAETFAVMIRSLKDSRRALEDASQQLAAESQRKDRFLALLGHELRNPLAAVRSALAVSQSARAEPDDAVKARDILTRQTTQLARLVDDLLDVTRISSGKILLRRSTVDIVRIARDSLEDIRPAAAGKGLTLEADLPADPLWVEGDRARLAQAIGNVLQNALKFTERGGLVRVAAAATPDEVEVSVEDTGIGMDPETLELVFQPFAQAEHGRGGLGLGMSLVRNLVELHGGRVLAQSAGPGQGSRFALNFPLVAAPAEPDARAQQPAVIPRRLLVVEDNPDAAESLKMLLELSGHTVIVAGSGREALAAVDEFHPDVVLCDIGLPGEMDGFAVASAIRARGAGPYLIALSGYGQRDDKRRAHEAGFDEHVTKPVSPVDLERLLASIPRHEAASPR